MNHYDKKFYNDQFSGSYESAKKILPLLFQYYKPNSIIDLGCGVGTWLKAANTEFGVKDILGVDGDYVNRQDLMIDADNFKSYDLTKKYTANKKYDMAISVEVGEHLPENSADNLVDSLTTASDVILFSAALVNQSGTYHINEQYPEYWAAKFIARGYTTIDYIRKHIWNDDSIDWWYRQNLLLFVKNETLETLHPALKQLAMKTDAQFLTRIHPKYFNAVYNKYKWLQTFNGFLRHKLYPIKQMFAKH